MSKVKFKISSEENGTEIEFTVEAGQELLDNVRNRPREMERTVLEDLLSDYLIGDPETYTAKIVEVEE
ncbi:hypothetical protein [Weissella viridescens]|uniref:hypothetical protein n=1 Tax=Weissella viridescens TaxID=1629 RepID=UPI0040568645